MNKTDLIVAIIENNASFKAGRITYEMDGKNISICNEHGSSFHETDLIVQVAPFCIPYLRINTIKNKIELNLIIF